MKRMFIKSVLLIVPLFFMALTVMAQGVVKGRIIDSQTAEPLIGATVMIEGTTEGVAADLDGSFSIKTSKTGKQVLIFRSVGYKEMKKEIVLPQDANVGNVKMETESIGLGDVTVTASVAVRRKTPVALSVMDPITIDQKLSTQEFPEILKSTPGVYATKQGGGYGDSRMNLRGFESENVAVMVNGAPMNEMEWGGIYWSNWTGMSDVTRSMQVQRGLGASKVASPSVGGSVNIVTNTTNSKAGGSISYAMGNDGYNKIAFDVSTGLRKGWAISILGSKAWGDGYIQGTNFTGYSYFANISKQINADHMLSFTVFGAPQKHNKRSDDMLITEWQKQPNKYKYNATYGFDMNGQRKSTNLNTYHKPQLSLNHFWTINEKSSLSTAVYASFGRGGGYSGQGYTSADRYKWYGTSTDGIINTDFRAADGTFDFGAIYAMNKASDNGSLMAMSNNINNHNWYGVLSTYTTQFAQYFNLNAGIDFRYYKGTHTGELIDLYGGDFYVDNSSRKNVKYKKNDLAWQNEKLKVGDVVYRDYDGYVVQEGAFAQLEYNKNALAVFVAGSLSNTTYWRYDRFYYDKEHAKSEKSNFIGYTFKGGANYNLNEKHNVFANIGYISRAPFLSDGVFLQKETSNELNKDAVNEKVFSMELGYGFRSGIFSANLNLYRTSWMDKAMATGLTIVGSEERGSLNLTGVDALHQGIEVDFVLRPVKDLNITGMFSLGDWKWNSNASGYAYDGQGQPLTAKGTIASAVGAEDHAKTTVNLKGVRVGNSAQTTFALGANYQILKGLRAGADYNYFARNYSKFNLRGSDMILGGVKNYETPWRIPSAGTMDANVSYNFPIGRLWALVSANVNNLLDQDYIADAVDGSTHDWQTAQVYYGFGRTYSVRLRLNF